jgi:D123
MSEPDTEAIINAVAKDILDCQFHKWFPLFKISTMKSFIIELPERFVDYLLEDSVILPSSESDAFGRDELSDDEDLTELSETRPIHREDFSVLTSQIKSAIQTLKGEVFVKFNWSAPTDAAWLRGGSLKCTDSADIYLLLKSSDRIVYDIENMFNLCPDCELKRPEKFTLILRSWANLDPAMEFRVFVASNQILGEHHYLHHSTESTLIKMFR